MEYEHCKQSSSGTDPCPDGAMKYRQQCTLLSGISLLLTRDSALRKSSNLLSMWSVTGCQLSDTHTHCVTLSLGGLCIHFYGLTLTVNLNLISVHTVDLNLTPTPRREPLLVPSSTYNPQNVACLWRHIYFKMLQANRTHSHAC